MERQGLPVFMQDPKTYEILKEVAEAIPKGCQVYLVGGAARNAVYYRLFHKKMPHRDYDILAIGNYKRFIQALRKRKFAYGLIKRKKVLVLKKKVVSKPRKSRFEDYVFLDIKFSKDSARKNLEEGVNFTINGFAIPLKALTSEKWYKQTLRLPTAVQDLKARQIQINQSFHASDLYSCLRFMSLGFKPPPKKETILMLKNLKRIDKRRFQRNIKKLFRYVGGEKRAKQLSRKLGIKENICDLKAIKNLIIS